MYLIFFFNLNTRYIFYSKSGSFASFGLKFSYDILLQMKALIFFIFLVVILVNPLLVFARVTPEDIANERKATYNAQVKNYSEQNQQKLKNMDKKIQQLNLNICGDLDELMVRQGQILDEYLARNNFKETEAIKNARYWITYAHEAVAYQQARIYIFDLTGETNLNRDVNVTINNLLGDITTLKGKVIKSQNILETVVSGGGDKSPAKQTGGGEG